MAKQKIQSLENIGSSTYNNIEKQKETNLIKYGEDSIFKTKKYKEKIKRTFNEKYGVDYATQLRKTIINSHSEEAIQKCFETQKRNKSINKSKEEIKSYELLKSKFTDVIHQYRDKERYPYFCDFYIPSLDTFIECQYAMFHNGRPYIGSEQDLNDIETLKQKSIKRKEVTGKQKSRYDAVIEIWSQHDVKKRQCAKEHNLNYLEFFTIKELEDWLNMI